MKHVLAGMISLTLLGCGTLEPIITAKEVDKPIATSCVPATLGKPKQYPDSDEALKAAGGFDERYRLVIAGRELKTSRLNEVEPVIQGCRK